jgi:FlaA1/EpsC-like NDP-sugar epimerase
MEAILHAAAYKHVPLVEANPVAGLANNVLGTRVLADAAVECGVGRFVLISTDKAVRPAGVMGASKRMAENVVQDLARRNPGTAFAMVRFGNVLGSSGSVVPKFRDQIAQGGPITLTHEDVSRYFMTLAEAARLVLLAGSLADRPQPGTADLCVLDMGQPLRIRDLAEQIDAHRKRVLAQHAELTLTGLYNVLAKVGADRTAKEQAIYDKGLVAVLKSFHDELDAAVAAAYGWPADLTDDATLERLLELNHSATA